MILAGAIALPEQIGGFPEVDDGPCRARADAQRRHGSGRTGVRFRRAVSLMADDPRAGLAQLLAGNRRVGRIAMRVWLGAVLALVGCAGGPGSWHRRGRSPWLSNTRVLACCASLLTAGAIGWAAAVHGRLAARSAAVPAAERTGSRWSGSTALLSLAVAGSLLFGAHLVAVQRDLIVTMFGRR